MNIKDLILEQENAKLNILQRHIDNGVIFKDVASVHIDESVEIGAGAVISSNNVLRGNTKISKGAILEENNVITDSEVGENVTVFSSVLVSAKVAKGTKVGPFAYLRQGADVGENCRIGDYVEIKNSKIGNGTKIAHLTYVGDAILGKDCNLGCGVVFANYDGEKKSVSEIGDECFLGSNCNIVAPVKVGSKSYIAAGTTVTKDVAEGSFIIGRVRQEKLNMRGKYRNSGDKHE